MLIQVDAERSTADSGAYVYLFISFQHPQQGEALFFVGLYGLSGSYEFFQHDEAML